jgi:hypothetical protein
VAAANLRVVVEVAAIIVPLLVTDDELGWRNIESFLSKGQHAVL